VNSAGHRSLQWIILHLASVFSWRLLCSKSRYISDSWSSHFSRLLKNLRSGAPCCSHLDLIWSFSFIVVLRFLAKCSWLISIL
jgi:hypothetical protein